jgi:Tfp pilus assembly protein PilF
MRRFDKRCKLPAIALMAAIVSLPSFGVTQPPAPQPSASQAETASHPATSALSSTLQPSPEELGDSLMAHQRYQAAIEAYKKAPQHDPTIQNKMGIAYQMMFDLTDAMHCYQKSFKLNPKNATVLNNLGTVYDALKEYHNAEKMYRKSLKVDPESALVMKNMGTNLLAQHKYQKGWGFYKAALLIDPQVFDHNSSPRVENPASVEERGAMNYYMAKGCVRAGMTTQAIEYLRAALNEGFTSPQKIIADNEFAALHGVPAFQQLLSSQKRQ